MRVAIHQPHYFPWVGYFDKMAQVDQFILLDQVQFEKGSYMYRNRILSNTGKVCYLTISAEKHGFLTKEYREIVTRDNEGWQRKQIAQIENAYCKYEQFTQAFDTFLRRLSALTLGGADGQHCDKEHRGYSQRPKHKNQANTSKFFKL